MDRAVGAGAADAAGAAAVDTTDAVEGTAGMAADTRLLRPTMGRMRAATLLAACFLCAALGETGKSNFAKNRFPTGSSQPGEEEVNQPESGEQKEEESRGVEKVLHG